MYIDWVRNGLKQQGKTGKGLARHLGVHASVISRMICGKRSIQADELPLIAEYLELPTPVEMAGARLFPDLANGAARLDRATIMMIQVKAKLARGVWRERQSDLDAGFVPATVDQRLKGLNQYACEFDSEAGRYGIFVQYSSYRVRPIEGDTVHVHRARGALCEDSLRTIRIGDDKLLLVAVDDKKDAVTHPSLVNHESVEIQGLMVAEYRTLKF